ncbi:conserved protein of unknown function [Cyanobium sp. NIES-981]|nr:conserved protein of unknown function [Cyanobium sp. NIES-981]
MPFFNKPLPPRIYCLAATQAPVVAVFRRGPTHWSHGGRWDLASRRYEPGAWLRGRIFPRRSDLSPEDRSLWHLVPRLPRQPAGEGRRPRPDSSAPPRWLAPQIQRSVRQRAAARLAGTGGLPLRVEADAWDERRNARQRKAQPGGRRLLGVQSPGWAGAVFGVDRAVDGCASAIGWKRATRCRERGWAANEAVHPLLPSSGSTGIRMGNSRHHPR